MDICDSDSDGTDWDLDGLLCSSDMRRCCICGKAIRSPFIIWDRNAEAYCYDCNEMLKQMKKEMREARRLDSTEERARRMYKRGIKPSEIAKRLGITTAEVYELLTESEDEGNG
jgi:ribosome-binding protein aMBF1 (putative translation factor)